MFSRLLSGEVELSCHVVGLPSEASGSCRWSLSSGDRRYEAVQIAANAGSDTSRLHLVATLPAEWPHSVLQVQVGTLSAEWPVIHPPAVESEFGLPLAGQLLVVGGHGVGEPHRSAFDLPSQQFGWDFLGLSNDRLAILRGPLGNAPTVETFSCFGQPVLAPRSGIVVTVVDGLADSDLVTGPASFDDDNRGAAGNHVVIDHGNQIYSCLAHLRRGSVSVEPGRRVESGESIGAVGASGNAYGPHIHLHFMDGADLVTSNPVLVPLAAEGQRFDPQAGQIIGP